MDDDELLADPVLGGIVRKLHATQAKLDEALTKVTAHDERLNAHEDTWLRNGYAHQLREIATYHNGRFNRDGKGKAFDQQQFLDYVLRRAQANPANDLGVAYNEFARQDEFGLVAREAKERGRQQGQREGARSGSSAGPWGAPRVRPPHLGGVESLQDLTDDQVLSDPDIQEALGS